MGALANGHHVVKSFRYLLTDPPQFGILAIRPWLAGRGPNATRSIETTRFHGQGHHARGRRSKIARAKDLEDEQARHTVIGRQNPGFVVKLGKLNMLAARPSAPSSCDPDAGPVEKGFCPPIIPSQLPLHSPKH